jgi:hypothetical protein
MALFKKIEEKNIGASPITLAVMETDDGIIVGRIVAACVDQFFSTVPYDPLIADAISIADRLAITNKVFVRVYDPQNRWQSNWGDLY